MNHPLIVIVFTRHFKRHSTTVKIQRREKGHIAKEKKKNEIEMQCVSAKKGKQKMLEKEGSKVSDISQHHRDFYTDSEREYHSSIETRTSTQRRLPSDCETKKQTANSVSQMII